MNERIKELAEQAGFSEDQYGLYWDEDSNAEGVDLERFAALILGECVRVCNKQTPNWKGEYATAVGDGIEFCISGIKDHFGIEDK